MKIKVENDSLIIYEIKTHCDSYECHNYENRILNVNALDLAKALKPYLDSIDNWELSKEEEKDV